MGITWRVRRMILLYFALAIGAYILLMNRLFSPNIDKNSSGDKGRTKLPPRGGAAPLPEVMVNAMCSAACEVLDLSTEITDHSRCYPLKVRPAAEICVYLDQEDGYVSRNLRQKGIWEAGIVGLVQRALRTDPNLGLIDVGANLGLYSLTAGAMGRQVVAVEPLTGNIQRFHKSIRRNAFEERITLVTNAVSNQRERVYFKVYGDNKGGTSMWEGRITCRDLQCPSACSVLLNDLLPVLIQKNLTKAVLKMDIEGAEHLALAEAGHFLSTIHIPLIFMEVAVQRQFCGRQAGPDSEDRRLTLKMFSVLWQHGYSRVYDTNTGKQLDPERCSKAWPRDVVWVKKTQKYPL